MENPTFSRELFFLIFKYLEGSGCQNAANALRAEIARLNLLPNRIDWQGNEHPQDFNTFESRNSHISNDFLLKIVSRVGRLLDQHIPSSVQSVNTLLGSGSQSLLRTSSDINHVNESHFLHSRLHHAPLKPSSKKAHPYSKNIVNLITSREVSGPSSITSILPTYMYERFVRCKRSLGHLACVYCVSFDRTGRFIFTGADDMLIKIWSAEDGRLLATLRGHSSEISDIAVNYENTMLATGSLDKMIRVWCLKTTSPICVLTGHTGMITSLSFCPYSKTDDRYLVSTSNDGSICFWKYKNSKQKFEQEPIKFVERTKQSAHLLCFSFSAGGSFLAVGSSDHYVRVYRVSAGNDPYKILEIQPHLDQVDSLQFSNSGLRFISGSKDGTANIWTYERSEWNNKTLHMNETLPDKRTSQSNSDQVAIKLKVTMVGWSLDDQYVITAANDHSIKVWESASGKLKYVLTAHDDEVFVIETHPTDPRIFLSGGHDGKIFLWDLSTGQQIKMFYNQIPGQGYGSIFDCKWSPDGSMFACTDSHGHVSIFTFDRSDGKYAKVPDEVFFHTDYRPLIRDANHYVIDEQTQCAPHLMPPPFLVDIDGNPYPPELQRLVPGREHCKDEDQLVPIVAIQNERGVNEILVPRDHNPQQPPNSNSLPNLNNSLSLPANGDHQQRPNIDDMIELLAQQQARHLVNEEHRYAANGSLSSNLNGQPQPGRLLPVPASSSAAADQSLSSSNRPGVRRSGDVEGIRQSTRNYQSRDQNAFNVQNRKYVSPLLPGEVQLCHRKLARYSQLEEETYQAESKRKPLPTAAALRELSNKGRVTRRKKLIVLQRRGYGESNALNSNRSLLNNTIEEEPSNQSDDSDDASFSIAAAEWQGSSSSSSENDSDSSDTDWGLKRNDPRSKRSKRKMKQRLAMNQANSSDSDEPAHPAARSSSRLNSRDARGSGHLDENEPSTSTGVVHRPTKLTRKSNIKIKEERERNTVPGEIYRPPEWLTEVMPKRAPYFPQVGDELIYFKKGHGLYIKTVRDTKAYQLPSKIPLLNNRNIRDEQPVKLIEIKYEIRPPTISILTLVPLTEEGSETEEKHAITYHDMKNVIDFLVPRKFFEQAMRTEWKPNDRFRSIIDNQWWFGTVKAIGDHVTGDQVYKNSNFQNIQVLWDSKDEENMSAWDLEQCTDRFPDSHAQGLSITDEERERLMYQPKPEDWPEIGRDLECDRLIRGLEKIMQTAWAESFNAPVDLNEFPNYGRFIAYPIDLSTIKTRLENRFYRNIGAVKFDVGYIERNARDFNEARSTITRNAKIVTFLVNEFIDKTDVEDPAQIIQMILHNKEMFESTEEDTDDDDDFVETRRGRKSIRKKNEPAWVAECKQLLNELIRNVDSEPFRVPVDLNEYDDYLEKVSTPMDLSTIKEQLLSGNYDEPKDLNKDLKLIFQNSKLYNTDKRSPIYAMTLRLQSLAADKIKSILNNYKQKQAMESNKSRSNRLTNGKGRKRKVEHNSSAEAQPSTSRARNEQATSSHYTNGHDRPSTSRAQSSRHEATNSNDEDYHPSNHLRHMKVESRQSQDGASGRPRRQLKPIPRNPDNEETTDLEEEESEDPFDVTINEETELDDTTEEDEQTGEQTDEEDTSRKIGRLTNGNQKSTKRKKGIRRTRMTNKKMKLINGGSFKGRKTSATESDHSFTDSSATDVDDAHAVSSKRSRAPARRPNNKNDKYALRKSKRKTAVDYAEPNDEFEYDFEMPRNTVSSRGRVIKMKGGTRD